MHPDLTEALAFGRGVLALAEEPALRHRVRRAVTAGELRRVLPGVYAQTARDLTAHQAGRALMAAHPEAVLVRESAAACHGWTEPPTECWAAARRRSVPGFRFEDRTIPEALVMSLDGVRVTSRALTALDRVDALGGAAIDDALRRGVPLAALWDALALTPQRPGNDRRRALLRDSRDQPWSEAERAAHAALRAGGVQGWTANLTIEVSGRRFVGDLVFRRQRLVAEIDGRAFHGPWEQRVRDMARDRALAAAGWVVLRFPAQLVLTAPETFVQEVRAALAARRR
nr:DUF559 domain-containing protein [Propionibacterium sp.]